MTEIETLRHERNEYKDWYEQQRERVAEFAKGEVFKEGEPDGEET